jgi:protein import protein ZIM17
MPHSDATSTSEEIAARKAQEPAYEITFTCRKCLDRSSHRITKQAYHFGTTLITCPGCKNRHLISDHLKIFSDKSVTLEDILREKGQFLKKGRLGEDGDIEFYDETRNEIGQKLAQEKDMQAQKKD